MPLRMHFNLQILAPLQLLSSASE